jgi:hypothetical protein
VQATVESGSRVGPLSAEGFGFWWVCRMQVETPWARGGEGGRGPSIVTVDDVSKTVELREACFDPPDGDCRYGTAANAGWQLYAGILRLLRPALVFIFLVSSIFYLLAGVLGAPRYLVLFDWWQRKLGRTPK